MAQISTALLISDDLDDHQAFTEAFQKVQASVIVIAVLSQDKALDLLASKKLVPDFVFLDLTSPDSDAQEFLSTLNTVEDGKKISLTVYGDEEYSTARQWPGVSHLDKEYNFYELVQFCRELLAKHNS
jgi:response regulator RpfG family c-di-GMP phosphodiesterase